MTTPQVQVLKLEGTVNHGLYPHVNLGTRTEGQAAMQQLVEAHLQARAARSKHVFLLEWEGNKIPRGAVIKGHSIGWTQNGIVTSEQGQTIGVYERLIEFGGDGGRDQKILVFVD